MNNNILGNLGVNMSNSFIIGCSILSCGIISNAYLNGISNIPLLNMKHKHKLQLQQIENNIDLTLINSIKKGLNTFNPFLFL